MTSNASQAMAPHSATPTHLFCHVLSIEPLIVIGLGTLGPFSPAMQLCEQLKDTRAYFLLISAWDLSEMTEFTRTVQAYHEHKRAYPNHEFIYLAPSEEDAERLRRCGVPAFFCHQNALIDERIYNIRQLQKSYDAIYNARLDPFKRHFLAKKIPSLALIYYNMSGQEGIDYQAKVFRTIPHAIPLNMASGSYRFLGHPEINAFICRAWTSLVLSESEGGNYASVEYLLSGVPVVSTRSTGGRDHFLNPEFCRIVDPNPAKVAAAVQELKEMRIDPKNIRRKTLMLCLRHRAVLQDIVQGIYDHEGAGRRFAEEWETVYINKMLNWGITDWQVLHYIRTWLGRTDKVVEPLIRDWAFERTMKNSA